MGYRNPFLLLSPLPFPFVCAIGICLLGESMEEIKIWEALSEDNFKKLYLLGEKVEEGIKDKENKTS